MSTNDKKINYGLGLSVIASIFFIFGFATTFIITLSAKIKDVFTLSEFEAQLTSSAFFITYLIFSIPSGKIIKKMGYKMSLVLGLVLMAIGSFLFFPAATAPSFVFFLIATFVLATGVVLLQTAANPYAAALGSEETSAGRMNLTQALNSVATMVAPWIISVAVFKGAGEALSAAGDAESVKMPFMLMGAIIVLIILILLAIKLPEIGKESGKSERKNVWKHTHVLLGALGIFFYVGAEVGIAGILVNYLGEGELSIEKKIAGKYVAIYWGGAMVGRFFGSVMHLGIKDKMQKYMYIAGILVLAFVSGLFVTGWSWSDGFYFLIIAVINGIVMQLGYGNPHRTLAVFAIVAALLALTTAVSQGNVALWTVISIGFFNSVMFPNIFALSVKGLDKAEMSSASGIINSLIVGGAVVPLLMGRIADAGDYSWAFFVPVLCYAYILFFAVKGSKLR